MTSPRYPLAIFAIASMLLIAGCGSSSDSSGTSGGAYGGGGETTATEQPASNATETAVVVSTASVPKLGKVIVNAQGFTLYDFHKDMGTTSSCYGGCANVWPPLTTTGKPQAGGGVSASKLGTTKRKDGTTQVTFAGHPLYTFTEDTKPGEANGNDIDFFGGEWYALTPAGEEP
jgi:predicted lipoprotein with Yx(FWY)xxD motif